MNEQEAFDIAYKALIKQGARSVTDGGTCKYYNPANGHRCAIGHLIDVETAKRWDSSDDASISTIPFNQVCAAGLGGLSHHFMDALQKAHDDARGVYFVAEFKASAAIIAEYYNLVIPEVNT